MPTHSNDSFEQTTLFFQTFSFAFRFLFCFVFFKSIFKIRPLKSTKKKKRKRKMLRRNARLRREYLYRKGLEGKAKEEYEKKKEVAEALAAGKAIPTELKRVEASLREKIRGDDDATSADFRSTMDDEYARAGVSDPRILITTARSPSPKLMQFAKELKLLFPNATRINRGGNVLADLVRACRQNDMTDLILVHETRGVPDTLIVSHMPYGPTAMFSISNCVMRHDIRTKQTMSLVYPHLVFHNFTTPLGERIMNVLKFLFPVAKDDCARVVAFANQDDFISMRHHVYRRTGAKQVDLKEVGPRFELRPFRLVLGTIDQLRHADVEWTLRPFMNSAKRRRMF
jgi:U3 small nucleolar ribonucleoprotein protein IMP4